MPIEAEPLLAPPALPDAPLLADPPVPVAPVLAEPEPLAPDPPEADDPEPLPIVAFARMKSPPDDDDDAPPALLDALLDAPDPLPDCRQPTSVMFWLPPLRELLLPDCPEVEPDVDPVEDPAPEPDPEPDPAPPWPAVDPPD